MQWNKTVYIINTTSGRQEHATTTKLNLDLSLKHFRLVYNTFTAVSFNNQASLLLMYPVNITS